MGIHISIKIALLLVNPPTDLYVGWPVEYKFTIIGKII